MSRVNVWLVNGDSVDVNDDTVQFNRTLDTADNDAESFEVDSETLAAVKKIVDLLDKADNGDVIVITKELW